MLAPVERFSSRVEDYVRYRPGYPAAIVDLLRAECGLTPAVVVADIGSGTGKLAELFLRNGNRVFAVEPNDRMRAAGEQLLAGFADFVSVAGAAEATTLPAASVDCITVGQALHWFDLTATAAEFRRIARPGGWVVVVWNDRRTDSPFQQAYETLLQAYAIDYAQISHQSVTENDIRCAFDLTPFAVAHFENAQSFDLAGLSGRLLSSSYAPEPGHPRHEPMLVALADLFARHQVEGRVQFEYETQVYYGRMSER